MDKGKEAIKNAVQKFNKIFASNEVSKSDMIYYFLMILIALIVMSIFWYITDKSTLKMRNCSSIQNNYGKMPPLKSIVTDYNYSLSSKLRDYYVKTAYNVCSTGDFKNSYVDLCALKTVIAQGYRCLDMAIYSVDDNPVVATSTVKSYDVKQTYNSIALDNVFKTIMNNAFSDSACPNSQDPLFLHLRIMSENPAIFNKIADTINSELSDRLLPRSFGYQNYGKNLGEIKLIKLRGRIIIMVDKENSMIDGSELEEFINIGTNSNFCRLLRFDDVKYNEDTEALKEHNKQFMSIVLPNISDSNSNQNAALPYSYGCQFVAMSVPNIDATLSLNTDMFNNSNHAFVLKPKELVYEPLVVRPPTFNKDEALTHDTLNTYAGEMNL